MNFEFIDLLSWSFVMEQSFSKKQNIILWSVHGYAYGN